MCVTSEMIPSTQNYGGWREMEKIQASKRQHSTFNIIINIHPWQQRIYIAINNEVFYSDIIIVALGQCHTGVHRMVDQTIIETVFLHFGSHVCSKSGIGFGELSVGYHQDLQCGSWCQFGNRSVGIDCYLGYPQR